MPQHESAPDGIAGDRDLMDRLEKDVPLAPHTSFRIGGPARYYTAPGSLSEFEEAIVWALAEGVPFFVLGGGSNILVHDRGFSGLVVNTKKLSTISMDGVVVTAQCGARIDDLVDACAARHLTGVEFAAGLPGTLGGALYMNARAYEGSFSSITESVHALSLEGRETRRKVLERDDLGFNYKKSAFQEGRFLVLEAVLRLERGSEREILEKIEENRRKRREMGQYVFPNAGCIFKNDYRVGVPAGKIIEELGLKGKRVGDAEVFEKHANFIVNRGKASAEDVYALIGAIEAEVREKRGITLEREILLVGDWRAGEASGRTFG